MKNHVTLGAILITLLIVASCTDEQIAPSRQIAENDLKTSVKSHSNDSIAYVYEALPNGTVSLSFTNTTGHVITGDIIRERTGYPTDGAIINEFVVGVGESYTFVDDDVVPGQTYRYVFEYIVEGGTGYIINIDEVAVVSSVPALGSFLLIAPNTTEHYDVLRNGYTILIEDTDIVVEANDLTQSVEFYLNGKKYKDNSAPFTATKNGGLKDGTYTLSAVAYPEKNGKGIASDTATVNFVVENTY